MLSGVRARRLAFGALAVYVVLVAATAALVAQAGGSGDQLFVVLTVGFAVVGCLVAVREPGNAVGWLCLGTAVTFAWQSVLDAYLDQPGRPGEVAVAWFAAWAWFVWLSLAGMFLPLVFPTGRLVSPRWRAAPWVGLAWVTLSVLTTGLKPGRLEADTVRPVTNPLGVAALDEAVYRVGRPVLELLAAVGYTLAAASLVVRLRRATGRERQQVKTFAYAGALAMVALLLAVSANVAGDDSDRWVSVVGATGWFSALLLIVVGLPLAVGVAILRHQLYDIDLVIKRTLVYGSLTAILASSYLVMVLVLRLVLSPVTGESDLAVAASTLAVAALFRPVRSRVQEVVDRRFFRARYDAARTLEGFSGRLRDELDLDTVGLDLRRVVDQTMAPTHVSLWLRGAT